jgi:hypothetical protein
MLGSTLEHVATSVWQQVQNENHCDSIGMAFKLLGRSGQPFNTANMKRFVLSVVTVTCVCIAIEMLALPYNLIRDVMRYAFEFGSA